MTYTIVTIMGIQGRVYPIMLGTRNKVIPTGTRGSILKLSQSATKREDPTQTSPPLMAREECLKREVRFSIPQTLAGPVVDHSTAHHTTQRGAACIICIQTLPNMVQSLLYSQTGALVNLLLQANPWNLQLSSVTLPRSLPVLMCGPVLHREVRLSWSSHTISGLSSEPRWSCRT